ncbi:hypothetical protein [Alkalibacillus aidingensis]|uniref:hypothetical protein n=1 Tax=Alkalibacillus aidingensis TaxID=2747607 RepID=UPI001660ABC7|nr:hypothetical protein [Alkalibacillus aidingensis]
MSANSKSIKITGEGVYDGGSYDHVKVIGKGTITGDIEASMAKFVGEASVQGPATFNQCSLVGKADVNGNFISDQLKVAGDLFVDGSLKADRLQLKGFVTTYNHMQVETINGRGGFSVDGRVKVKNLMLNLQVALSRAKEISGESISVKSRCFFRKPGLLEVDVVEGQRIYLENTTAKIVKGKEVEIGPGCQIDVVEYEESYHCKSKNSDQIKEVYRI